MIVAVSCLIVILLCVFPYFFYDDTLYQTPEVVILISISFIATFSRNRRAISSIFKDRFALIMILLNIMGLVVVGLKYEGVKDLNLNRWLTFFPLIFYLFYFYVGSHCESSRYIYLVLILACFVVNILTILITVFPSWDVWQYYFITKLQDEELLLKSLMAASEYRNPGIFNDEIFAANYFVISGAIGYSFALLSKGSGKKSIGFGLFLVSYYNMYTTFARGPFLIFSLVITYRVIKDKQLIAKTSRAFILTFLLSILPFIVYLIDLILTQRDAGLSDVRADYWVTAISIITSDIRNVLIGVHENYFFISLGIYHPHNFYLNVALIMGVPFMLLFFSNLFTMFTTLNSKWRQSVRSLGLLDDKDRPFALYAVYIILSCYLFEFVIESSFFLQPRLCLIVYLLLGLSVAKSIPKRKEDSSHLFGFKSGNLALSKSEVGIRRGVYRRSEL